ncbi:YraN family protein [Chitinophaga sancti]|uniref:YraN family protein n=1 Tax=Chitinophaga sancti TaxID=1004 RepID=UPI002A74FAF8|nr:YraN family protein [Chitinophaga sancti]WPQ60816.1 YraN family protein [Chitinophaga sancti]
MLTYLDLGKKGEEIASAHFLAQDYIILHANWKLGRKEIDLIVRKGECLVFVEVKTLATDIWGFPEKNVTERKIRHIRAVANGYMDRMRELPKRIRFDIVAITFRKDGSHELVHFEDCF